jgi:hypothetical protein
LGSHVKKDSTKDLQFTGKSRNKQQSNGKVQLFAELLVSSPFIGKFKTNSPV